MLKRILILLLFLFASWITYVQGERLSLAFFVLFPLLVFPMYYFFAIKDRILFGLASATTVILYGSVLSRSISFVSIAYGIGFIILLALIIIYRMTWQRMLEKESAGAAEEKKSLMALEKKYYTRLESLHRLEKQVGSLMGLFEIARDFSEALSFDAMTKLLREKVLPELPFEKMQFVMVSEEEAKLKVLKNYEITSSHVMKIEAEFDDKVNELIKEILNTKQTTKVPAGILSPRENAIQGREDWIFPLIIENKTASLMIVEGSIADDFVRFEVLAAHLVLQVKKINLYETVKELSIIDGLTGVYVRRHFLERFKEELERSIKFNLPLTVLMLDIDHFKRYNDDFGHLVGDATLKEVARLLRESLRKVDIVARYGGEEFIAVLPETNYAVAGEVAERVRSHIARHHFKVYDVETQVTASLGICVFPNDLSEEMLKMSRDEIGFELIRHADKALYRAKEEGRNRVYKFQDL